MRNFRHALAITCRMPQAVTNDSHRLALISGSTIWSDDRVVESFFLHLAIVSLPSVNCFENDYAFGNCMRLQRLLSMSLETMMRLDCSFRWNQPNWPVRQPEVTAHRSDPVSEVKTPATSFVPDAIISLRFRRAHRE